MDRDDLFRLVGRKVVVGLNSAEGGGVEIYATLDAVGDDGIVLSQITELGPGPTLFCPWDNFRRAREQPPWFLPPDIEPRQGDVMQIREQPEKENILEDEILSESIPRQKVPSARTLERVVPVAQRATVDGITVAIVSLELYGRGFGMLRWLISFDDNLYRGAGDFGIPEPELEIRDDNGRTLPWSPRGEGASDGEADGEARVEELPDAGGLEITVARLISDAYGDEEHRGDGLNYEGPWTFRFSL